MLPPTYMDVGG